MNVPTRMQGVNMNAPPGLGTSGCRAVVHDRVTKHEEPRWFERLGEEVCKIEVRANERDLNLHALYALSHEEVTPVYVLHARVMLWVIGNRDGGLIVYAQLNGRLIRLS